MSRPGGGGAPGWAVLFRLALAVLALSTLNGLYTVFFRGEQLRASFPGAKGMVLTLLLATTGAGLVSLAAMGTWRRWGLWIFGFAGAATLVLDEMASAPRAHQAAVLGSTLAILALAYPVRDRFRRG